MGRFTFGEVEAILAEANDIASEKRVAFSSRLKNLQKQGLRDASTSPGRGRVARLEFLELIELAAGVELVRLGLPPQRAASLVTKNRETLQYTAYLATYGIEEAKELAEQQGLDAPEAGYIWLFRVDGLAELTSLGESEYDDYEAGEAVGVSEVARIFETGMDGYGSDDDLPRRYLVINGSRLCRQIVSLIVDQFRLCNAKDLRGDIEAQLEERTKTIESLIEIIESRSSRPHGDT